MSDGILTFVGLASVVGGLYGFGLLVRDVSRRVLRGIDWLVAHQPFAERTKS